MAIQNFVLIKEGGSFATVSDIMKEINDVINNPTFTDYIAQQAEVGNLASSMDFIEGGNTIEIIRDWDDAAYAEFLNQFSTAQEENRAKLEAAGWTVAGTN